MNNWQWIACGKHPAARDYIRLGNQFQLGSTVFSWIEQGYSQLQVKSSTLQGIKWRFWLKGAAPNTLACGIIRESSDAIGRPYPLLLIGSGNLPGWEGVWEHLPVVCEPAWNDADKLASSNLSTVSEFQMGLGQITSPVELLLNDDTLPPVLPVKTMYGDFSSELSLFSLETSNYNSIATAAAMRLSLRLKQGTPSPPPVAVFIGGKQNAYMAVIRRPLRLSDFSVLWDLQER